MFTYSTRRPVSIARPYQGGFIWSERQRQAIMGGSNAGTGDEAKNVP
jgi:hypothetical protein